MTAPNAPIQDPSSRFDAELDTALRSLHRNVLAEPVPHTLHDTARRIEALSPRGWNRWPALSLAATVLVAFGVGWFANTALQKFDPTPAMASAPNSVHEFVRQAGYAYAAYMPEKKHPVEVSAAEQEHLVQWLSKRLAKPLKIPALNQQGFDLVGGRLLPGANGVRAQFMYQNAQGLRLTLYLGAIGESGGVTAPELQSAQFRLETNGPVPSFYWADQGFGYALSGPMDSTTLLALARTVYSQISN